MSAAQRAEAVKGVFDTATGAELKGKRVVIIDDVTNTGATLREAKRALKKAGAIPVAAAVLARVSRQPSL
jgi:predicted amidophosphoribosyltransferase